MAADDLEGFFRAGLSAQEAADAIMMPPHGSRWRYRGVWVGVVDTKSAPGKVRCSPEGHSGVPYDWSVQAFLRAFKRETKP